MHQWVQYRKPGSFPRGTWLINITGSYVLELLVSLGARHGLPEQIDPIAGVGFCGSCTTFSTFSYELVRLCEQRQVGTSLLYGGSSLATGSPSAAAGLAIGTF
ncbi:CrcB family protein [Streptomyces sp. R41]|uniref:Fluoride-specific ion channel n=1 Tax=Streptomyces sp. R41 TaxID=3238632 RepID=A0AB39RP55_9ACTN